MRLLWPIAFLAASIFGCDQPPSPKPAPASRAVRNSARVTKSVARPNQAKEARTTLDAKPPFDESEMLLAVNALHGYSIEDYRKLPNCLDVFKACLGVPYEGKTSEQYKTALSEIAQKPCRVVLRLIDVSADYDFAEFEILADEGEPGLAVLVQGGDLNNYAKNLRTSFPINHIKKKGLGSNHSIGDRVVLVGLGYVVDASSWGAAMPKDGMPRGDERQVMLRAFGKPHRSRPYNYEFAFMVRNWYIASQ